MQCEWKKLSNQQNTMNKMETSVSSKAVKQIKLYHQMQLAIVCRFYKSLSTIFQSHGEN